jgi:hypothetical protein
MATVTFGGRATEGSIRNPASVRSIIAPEQPRRRGATLIAWEKARAASTAPERFNSTPRAQVSSSTTFPTVSCLRFVAREWPYLQREAAVSSPADSTEAEG